MQQCARLNRHHVANIFLMMALFALAVFPGSAQESPAVKPAQTKGWPGYARDQQHTALSSIASQPLTNRHWSTPVDLQSHSGEILIHYGSPLITSAGTVIVPVKTGQNSFRVDAHSQATGTLRWSVQTDYKAPAASFLPSFSPVLANNKLYMPAAGGTVLVRDQPDQPTGKVSRLVFYGANNFNGNRQLYSNNVEINTPITADSVGNLYFGFVVLGATPIGLQSGLARISATGQGLFVAAATAAGDQQITKVDMSCAPALSHDEKTLYVGVNNFEIGRAHV